MSIPQLGLSVRCCFCPSSFLGSPVFCLLQDSTFSSSFFFCLPLFIRWSWYCCWRLWVKKVNSVWNLFFIWKYPTFTTNNVITYNGLLGHFWLVSGQFMPSGLGENSYESTSSRCPFQQSEHSPLLGGWPCSVEGSRDEVSKQSFADDPWVMFNQAGNGHPCQPLMSGSLLWPHQGKGMSKQARDATVGGLGASDKATSGRKWWQ